jgi:hypothetical protein
MSDVTISFDECYENICQRLSILEARQHHFKNKFKKSKSFWKKLLGRQSKQFRNPRAEIRLLRSEIAAYQGELKLRSDLILLYRKSETYREAPRYSQKLQSSRSKSFNIPLLGSSTRSSQSTISDCKIHADLVQEITERLNVKAMAP